jgi:NAD(P)H-flavin reductase
MNPELNLIPWGHPVKVPVVSIRTLKPDDKSELPPPEKSDVFEIVLDVTDTKLTDKKGNPQIWPGHHLRIKCDIPSGLNPDYAQYLEDMQSVGTFAEDAKVESEADRDYLRSRPYSIANVEKRPNGRVWATLVVRRVVYEQDHQTRLGLRSNQLARKRPGDLVKITGPANNKFILPPRDANMLVVTTGGALGPMKFPIDVRLTQQSGTLGQTRLYAGCRSWKDVLYEEAFQAFSKDDSKNFHFAVACSQDPKMPGQLRQHVQDLLTADADQVLKLLMDPKTFVYICGILKVETEVEKTLLEAAKRQGKYTYWKVQARIEQMKKTGQWRAEGVRLPGEKKSGVRVFFQSLWDRVSQLWRVMTRR